jgi:hypothetical protein
MTRRNIAEREQWVWNKIITWFLSAVFDKIGEEMAL